MYTSYRKAMKKEKRKYRDMYKGFCRFVSSSCEYKGLIKDRRQRFRAITKGLRNGIRLLESIKHIKIEHP